MEGEICVFRKLFTTTVVLTNAPTKITCFMVRAFVVTCSSKIRAAQGLYMLYPILAKIDAAEGVLR